MWPRVALAVAACGVAVCGLVACGGGATGSSTGAEGGAPASSGVASAPAASGSVPVDGPAATPREASARPRIVFLGDSLTAGLGLAQAEAFPALVGRRLEEAGYDVVVVNAGVSGDTSAGGVRRFDWSTDGDVRILVLALGANDGLRGLPVGDLESNLAAIIERAQARGMAVLLCGMEAPPNFGSAYTQAYRDVFRRLTARYDVAYLPFLLDGVAGVAELNQRDGIHPNAEGAARVADLIWTALRPLLQEKLPS